jgi:hypothetical protein
MPDSCSCGSELPPDALFCHKCGKPQRELPEVAVDAPTPVAALPPLEPPPPAPMPLDFRNPLALRIAMLVAVCATALFWISPVNWLAAGYFAVFLYRRRAGCPVNVAGGLRLGWITGVFIFPAAAVAGFYQIKWEAAMPQFRSQPHFAEAMAVLQSSSGVIVLLIVLFIFTTCISMVGGALAARLGRPSPPRGGRSV